MEARTGRVNQRESSPQHERATGEFRPTNRPPGYGPLGERLVAGVVALSPSKTQVLLIQATKRTAWVLPKGGWELDEATPQVAACREAWEEAGVICTVVRDLGKIAEMRAPGQVTSESPKAEYQFYEVSVEREEREWPEMHKRARMWMGYAQARQALVGRPELLEALERSSIVR